MIRWVVLLCAACGSSGGDPNLEHNLEALNSYRAANGVPALTQSAALDSFASTGSQQLAAGASAHGHFQQAVNDQTLFSSGFCHSAGENQAPSWPLNGNESAAIDAVLKTMMDEGPGGGHHDNIVNPDYRLVGIGLVVQDGKLYLTNDFSNACP